MYSKTIIVVVIIVLLVVALGFFLFQAMNKSQTSQNNPTPPETSSEEITPSLQEATSPGEEATEGATMEENAQSTFTISATGSVSPKTITIKVGQSVTWVNNSGSIIQVNSAPHPAHTDYPPLNSVGEIATGGKESLSFPTPGVYRWHDHLNPSSNGSITVE